MTNTNIDALIKSTIEQPLACHLNHWGILSISGPDAQTFLQGQLTCDLNQLSESQSVLGAYCNRQGRVIANFIITEQDNNYLLLLPSSTAEICQQQLKKFALFSKVTIQAEQTTHIIGEINTDQAKTLKPKAYNTKRDANHLSINIPTQYGQRCITLSNTLPPNVSTDNTWQLMDIADGIPWVSAKTSQRFTIQQLRLDQLGAVSFTKGCFLGQEIVARTHYRGKTKQQLICAQIGQTSIEDQQNITDPDQKVIGNIINDEAIDDKQQLLLACVNINARNAPMLINEHTLVVVTSF